MDSLEPFAPPATSQRSNSFRNENAIGPWGSPSAAMQMKMPNKSYFLPDQTLVRSEQKSGAVQDLAIVPKKKA